MERKEGKDGKEGTHMWEGKDGKDRSEVVVAAVSHEPPADLTAAHEWVSEPELRERLQYGRTTVARLRARGLPHVGSGRLRRYPWEEVIRWLRERA
jgi:hypothetical protein